MNPQTNTDIIALIRTTKQLATQKERDRIRQVIEKHIEHTKAPCLRCNILSHIVWNNDEQTT